MKIKLSITTSLILLVTIFALVSVLFIYKYLETRNQLTKLKSNPTQLTALLETENQKTLSQLGQLIDLPQETPRIITITDKASVANEPLLSKAETGDTFIIYSGAKKAILYRPSQNKIIDVIPISAPVPTVSLSPTPTKRPN